MKPHPRSLSIVLLALLVALAGCSALTGDEPIAATASKATVSDSALSETGYVEIEVREYAINRTITIGNVSRHVNVTNYVAGYRKNYSGGLPGGFGVLSTPQVEILGQGVNPLGHLGKKALIEQVLSQVRNARGVGTIEGLQRTGNRTVTMLGNETKMTVFSGTVTQSGKTVDVTAYLARTKHGDDIVIAGGVHPSGIDAGSSDVTRLIGGITHDAGT